MFRAKPLLRPSLWVAHEEQEEEEEGVDEVYMTDGEREREGGEGGRGGRRQTRIGRGLVKNWGLELGLLCGGFSAQLAPL